MKSESYAFAHAHLRGPASADYRGPERRKHKIYVTRNTEYHVNERLCVAVRDRRTGEFLNGHLAIDRSVEGGLRFGSTGGIVPNAGDPGPGESLYFPTVAGESRDLVTSPVECVERPGRELVGSYPARRRR